MITGCSLVYSYKSVPEVQKCSNDYYEAIIQPIENQKGFALKIINKTDKNLELDWNRTLFIKNGQTSGGSIFEGILYRDRHNPKPPDIIFPRASLLKAIMPNNLVEYKQGWKHKSMESGEYGVLLAIKVNDNEVMEKMLMRFIKETRYWQ